MAALPDQLLAVLLCTVQDSLQVQHLTEACSCRVLTKAAACAYPSSMLAGSMPLWVRAAALLFDWKMPFENSASVASEQCL